MMVGVSDALDLSMDGRMDVSAAMSLIHVQCPIAPNTAGGVSTSFEI
jgi:hypothetical protein